MISFAKAANNPLRKVCGTIATEKPRVAIARTVSIVIFSRLQKKITMLTLHKVFKRVPYFVKGHSKYIAEKVKREKLYIQTLESLYKPDAELFLMVKDKQIDQTKYRGLTEKLFRETFPELLPGKEEAPKQTGS